MNIPTDGWKLVGYFDVDAGLCWIGDPCYVLPADHNPIGRDWRQFCDTLSNDVQIQTYGHRSDDKYPNVPGEQGHGVVVSTGYGDGSYPVYVRWSDSGGWGNRPMQIFIDFEGDDADDNSGEG